MTTFTISSTYTYISVVSIYSSSYTFAGCLCSAKRKGLLKSVLNSTHSLFIRLTGKPSNKTKLYKLFTTENCKLMHRQSNNYHSSSSGCAIYAVKLRFSNPNLLIAFITLMFLTTKLRELGQVVDSNMCKHAFNVNVVYHGKSTASS